METSVERDIKELKNLAKKFFVIGVILAVVLFVVDKAHLIKADGSRWRYESLNMNDEFKLPYKHNNLLSTKEGVLTEYLLYRGQYEYNQQDVFHPKYKVVDKDAIILYDGVKKGYGITDGEGNWIIEPKYRFIDDDDYEKYGVFVLDHCEVVDGKGRYIINSDAGFTSIKLRNGKIIFNKGGYTNNQYGVCDLNGNIVIEPKYKDIRDVYCGDATSEQYFFIVQDSEGKWFTCNKDGKEYMSDRYDDLNEENIGREGLLVAEKDGKKSIINALSGEELLEIDHDVIKAIRSQDDPSKYAFIVETNDEKVGVITMEDGLFEEPDHSIYYVKLYDDGTYAYYSDSKVVSYTYERNGTRTIIIKKGKEAFEIEAGENISIYEDRIFVDKGEGGDSYWLDYDGERIEE